MSRRQGKPVTVKKAVGKGAVAEPPLYGRVCEILDTARAHIARTVNTTQVMANWLIGREMVEEEQRGKRRANYGQQLVAQLSAQLPLAYGRGWSPQNLFYMKHVLPGLSGFDAAG